MSTTPSLPGVTTIMTTPMGPLASHVTERTGLSFDSHRTRDLVGTLERAVGTSGAGDVAAYLDLLRAEPARFDALVERLTVGETHFFREPGHLELLRGRILPGLLRERPAGHRLRVWSAGCATGEEAYTLAIVLEEEGLADRADVLGTDLSPSALAVAEQAIYRAWSLRGVNDARRLSYFHQEGDRFRLADRFTRRVAFRPLNLLSDPYPSADDGGVDVIFCRNVLIYLTPQAVDRVVRRLVDALADGGWLVTASSDPHLAGVEGLETVATREGVVYRRRRAAAAGRTTAAAVDSTGRRGSQQTPRRRRVDRRERPVDPAATAAAWPQPTMKHPDVSTDVGRVGRLADSGHLDAALELADELAVRNPLDAEVHHLRAVLFLESARWAEAAMAATTSLYLDPSLAVSEIVLGRAELARGHRAPAIRAFRNARRLLAALPPDAPVPLAEGASAGRLAAELDRLESGGAVADGAAVVGA